MNSQSIMMCKETSTGEYSSFAMYDVDTGIRGFCDEFDHVLDYAISNYDNNFCIFNYGDLTEYE